MAPSPSQAKPAAEVALTTKSLGGASSAVAASSHAACPRFRGTDPLVTGVTRRRLAREVGYPDTSGRIPEARWMRAMTFERLVRDRRFASEVATTAVGSLRLARPTAVMIQNAHLDPNRTAALLTEGHKRAVADGTTTMLYGLAIPFAGFEDLRATDVKPDFAVIAQKRSDQGEGSWLILGDAKDYERVRSRIDDRRLLKGFLQVALGAESAELWSKLPVGMGVHRYGILAVPRNAFLQPEPLVEPLDDYRTEVAMRVAERRAEAEAQPHVEEIGLVPFVEHLKARFDPASCTTCSLFSYCRDELRKSSDPEDLLVELGVREDLRPTVLGVITEGAVPEGAPASVVATIRASLEGRAQPTGQLRIDQAGLPGTVNVVLAKSDAAALGVHGMGVQRVTARGRQPWSTWVFDDPQGTETRRAVMRLLGKELTAAMKEMASTDPVAPSPIHLVVPDPVTADVLVSMADNLAGVELSRLRWRRDKEMGRKPLTFNGEPAVMPRIMSAAERIAVSFLLEEDRARSLTLRSPVVDVRLALALHFVAGGPAINSLRLDYLEQWVGAAKPVDHRVISDSIEGSAHTPGARLTNQQSDKIHRAFVGRRSVGRAVKRPVDSKRYASLVEAELSYKTETLEVALDLLDRLPDSRLREVYRQIEGDAQAVWRRRSSFHASDLVRFGRTYRYWRNALVPIIESDTRCRDQLLTIGNPQVAVDAARDAGTREVATAIVVGADPLAVEIDSRHIVATSRIVLLHVNGVACIEQPGITVTPFKGSFRFGGLSIGPLAAINDPRHPRKYVWTPELEPQLSVGDELVVADFAWFSHAKRNRFLSVARPAADTSSAPKETCTPNSFAQDPHTHLYCCRPHEDSEAEWSDMLASRRSRGELNPTTWPPIFDEDAFEVSPSGAPVGDPMTAPTTAVPSGVTSDDID